MIETILFGACMGAAAGGVAAVFHANPFGARGGWLEDAETERGSLGGLLLGMGEWSIGRLPRREEDPVVQRTAAFLRCSPTMALGVLAMVVVALAALVLAWWTSPQLALLAVGALWFVARQRRAHRARARYQAWELEMAALLSQVAYQVAAGRTLRRALESAGAIPPGPVAEEFVDHVRVALGCGRDTASALETAASRAPDRSTGAFLALLALTHRSGEPVLPVLDVEVLRLRDARRRRLEAAIQELPTRLGLFRVFVWVSALCVLAAWMTAWLGGMGSILEM